MGIGEFAALASAFLWAATSFIYSHLRLSAWVLNLSKCLIACGFFSVHLAVLKLWLPDYSIDASVEDWGYLGISGVIGILIGDTCYFRSLQILGPNRALMLTLLSPIFAFFIGFFFLSEQMTLLCGLGLVVALLGISIVISDQRGRQEEPGIYPGTLMTGIQYAAMGAACQAIGGAIAKIAIQGDDGVDPLFASLIRIIIPTTLSLVVVLANPKWRKQASRIFLRENFGWLIGGSILGTWLGIWLMLIAYKESELLAVAQTLLSTSPLFLIPLAYLLKKHVSSWRTICGAVVAIGGIYILVKGDFSLR